MHYKRKRPKNRRAGCLMCKPHKANGVTKKVKIKGLKGKINLMSPILDWNESQSSKLD